MIPEIDIWRVANLMLKRYGDEAETESERRADELWEVGDAAGVAADGPLSARPHRSSSRRRTAAMGHETRALGERLTKIEKVCETALFRAL
jgi:hypothetical protein